MQSDWREIGHPVHALNELVGYTGSQVRKVLFFDIRLQCGVFVSVNDHPEDAGFDLFSRARTDHMQWNVHVHVDYRAIGWSWSVHGGALVKPNMVLTSE